VPPAMFLLHVYVKLHCCSCSLLNEATQINNKMSSLCKLEDSYFSCLPVGTSSHVFPGRYQQPRALISQSDLNSPYGNSNWTNDFCHYDLLQANEDVRREAVAGAVSCDVWLWLAVGWGDMADTSLQQNKMKTLKAVQTATNYKSAI
jgi:hypothetical protein